MNVLIFGATGMIGQGVLRECLQDPDVGTVTVVGRSSTGRQHEKLLEIIRADVSDLAGLETELAKTDACLFCLGVSAAGMSQERYRELTYELTIRIARTLAALNPEMTFVYVSGMGTDGSEEGRIMWARVKGKTENELLRLPFRAAYMFRPGVIIPRHGIRSRARLTRVAYAVTRPIHSLLESWFPRQVTTTDKLAKAMIAVARDGFPKKVLEARDINNVPLT